MAEPCDDTDRVPVEDLVNAANQSKEIETDTQRVERRSLNELIALDKYLANRKASCQASGNGWGMVAKSRVVPPSTIGEERPENGG